MNSLKKKFIRKVFAFGGGVIIALAMVAVPAQASIVRGLTDEMSSQKTGVAANHTIEFTMPADADDADPAETITLAFASSFTNTSNIDEGDIDVADDGVNLTLEEAPCDEAKEAAITFATDVGSGFNILSIEMCTATILAGSTVTIEIGTNATSEVAGDEQIGNPAAEGSHSIYLGGTFGDSGRLAVGISSPGSVTVNASFPSGGGNGGGGGGGGGDTTAPTISNVVVTNITQTSADVTWQTNEAADSKVDYGFTASYELGTRSDAAFVTNHSIALFDLVAGTEYHFRVRSADSSNNEAGSDDFTFTTASPPDTTPPMITDVQVTDITGTSAKVRWATDEPATSQVDYGLTTGYGATVEDSMLVLDHEVDLNGLVSETTYHFRVLSVDASGNEAPTGDFTFTTADITPPVISGLAIGVYNESSARVTWNTNEMSTTEIAYGKTTDYELGVITNSDLATLHNYIFTGLTPNTLYHLQARSTDAAGNTGASDDQTFTTFPDTTPPANVTNFSAEETQSVHLTWNNPPDNDLAGIRVVRRSDHFPGGPQDGTLIFDGLAEEAVDGSVAAGATYYYGAYAYDTSGNFASGAITQITLISPPEFPICGNNICEANEDLETYIGYCPADCVVQPEPETICGNSNCETGENVANCPADCLAPPVTVSEHISLEDFELLVANQKIRLEPRDTNYEMLLGTVLWVRISADAFPSEPEAVRFILGSSAYSLARGADDWTTAVMTPSAAGEVPMVLSIIYPDGGADRLDASAIVRGWGRVVGELADGATVSVSGALVSLFDGNNNLWDAETYGQKNSDLTRADGSFAWYAPNGNYRLHISKDGFRGEEVSLSVAKNIVNPQVSLIVLPVPPIETIGDIVSGEGTPIQKVAAIGDVIGQSLDYGTAILQKEVLDNPQVEKATTFAAPAVATAAAASAGAAATTVGLANLLRFLFTQPAVFFSRRKRKAWGQVFNAITKLPIELATIRLRDAMTGRLIQTRVSDRGGRYFFIAQPGTYRIEAMKQNFIFPTAYLKDKASDPLFLDIYHGEEIKITDKDATIAANIPLDPEVKEKLPAEIRRKIFWRKLESVVSIASPIIAGGAVIISPTKLNIGLFIFQVLMYSVIAMLVRPRKPKGWGIVYDENTKRPLKDAIVRVFEPVYGKLLEMQLTNTQGRYSFLVGPNMYKVAAEKTGYVTKQKEIDFREKKEPEVVKEQLALTPGKKGVSSPLMGRSDEEAKSFASDNATTGFPMRSVAGKPGAEPPKGGEEDKGEGGLPKDEWKPEPLG